MKFSPNLFDRRSATGESRCGIAFDAETDEVVIAERARGGGFNIWHVPRNERRTANIVETEVRTAVLGWNAHSDRSQLITGAGNDDETILRTLVEAIRMIPNSSATSFAWARTPDRKIAITQADRSDVDSTVARLKGWLSEQSSSHISLKREPRIRVETATRAIARLWLREASERLPVSQAVAFLTVGRDGYAVGLWSDLTGLIYETEESFEPDASPTMAAAHTCESILKLIDPSSVTKLSLPPVSIVVISSVKALEGPLAETLRRELSSEDISVKRIRFSGATEASSPAAVHADARPDEISQATALALGALFDSSQVPLIDLATDLESEYQVIVQAREENARRKEMRKIRTAVAAILAPFLIGIGVVVASYFDLSYETVRLQEQINVEQQEAQRLKAEAALRIAAKNHFAEYLTLINQTLELRRRQPATAQLINDLNQQWPPGDPSWHISEMKTKAGGIIEFKGRTQKEESVTAFTHGLEFSNGLFTNVSNNIQSVSATNVETPTGGSRPLLDFTVHATYTPLQNMALQTSSATAAPRAGGL